MISKRMVLGMCLVVAGLSSGCGQTGVGNEVASRHLGSLLIEGESNEAGHFRTVVTDTENNREMVFDWNLNDHQVTLISSDGAKPISMALVLEGITEDSTQQVEFFMELTVHYLYGAAASSESIAGVATRFENLLDAAREKKLDTGGFSLPAPEAPETQELPCSGSVSKDKGGTVTVMCNVG